MRALEDHARCPAGDVRSQARGVKRLLDRAGRLVHIENNLSETTWGAMAESKRRTYLASRSQLGEVRYEKFYQIHVMFSLAQLYVDAVIVLVQVGRSTPRDTFSL